jgi:hypothetical protein
MWTENVTWFSNEVGKKGQIKVGQFADLIVPDRDFFACAEHEIADSVSELTMVGGKIVYSTADFSGLEEVTLPAAMPDWSPVRRFGGYAAWGDEANRAARVAVPSCGCGHACGVHGHDHARSWASRLPVDDLKSFWGALGCACWAV